MKVEIPDYFLKSFIRHFERITENCKASPSDIKTSEALRLGKKDVIKLKRFINKKVYFMKRRIIGIDVGKNGGIVVYDTENNKLLECIKMPPTPKDLLDFLSIYKENSVCYLERVNGMTGQSASASFVFGEGYGQLTMGLIACGIPTVTVSPQTWQKTIGLRNTDKLGKTEWKNILKKKAQQLFPYAKVTLATSDALLICEYGRIKEKE